MKIPSEIVPLTPEQGEFFDKICPQYERFLYYIVKSHTTDYSDQEDIMQDAWCRLMKQAETLMGLSEPALRKYICKAAESACVENHEKKHPEYIHVEYEENTLDLDRTKWDFVSDLHVRELLEKVKNALTEREWLALEGKYYYGFSDEKLAKQMGVKANSVRMLRSRILRKLRDILPSGSLIGGGGNER